jgi:hypothetical protein
MFKEIHTPFEELVDIVGKIRNGVLAQLGTNVTKVRHR